MPSSFPQWITAARTDTDPQTGAEQQIVTFQFIDAGGATLAVNLTNHQVIVNWSAIPDLGASTSVFVNDENPDGSRPGWRPV